MPNNPPEGMTPVAGFAKLKGLSEEDVIKDIREGIRTGRKVGDDWYVDKSELHTQKSRHRANASYKDNNNIQGVVVTDIRMPFGSMVTFMIKWAIAAIPAFIILFVLFFIVVSILITLFGDPGAGYY